MYKINLNEKFARTLKAINVTDPKAKDKSVYQTLNDKHDILFVLDPSKYIAADFNLSIRKVLSSITENINIDLNSFLDLLDQKYHQEFVSIFLSNHEFINAKIFTLKTTKNKDEITHNYILSDSYKDLINLSNILVEAENFSRKLQLMPSNYLNPKKFIEFVKNEFKPFQEQIDLEVFEPNKLEEMGMGLLLGVGNSANDEDKPRLLVIKSKNYSMNNKSLALVGKGITFDTGGVCLKPSNYLAGMQYDMSGAAVVAGVMLALTKAKVTSNVCAVIPLAVNDISNLAIKTGDVLTSYSKKTVEIENTDAEGRLILADAISYAKKDLKAGTILTIATLTGAIVVAFGGIHTGMWATSKDQETQIKKAAIQAGEYVWHMPFHFTYDEQMKHSLLADYINCAPGRNCGSSTAATFLKFFAEDSNFLHLDIAGTNEIKTKNGNEPYPAMLRSLFYFTKNNF